MMMIYPKYVAFDDQTRVQQMLLMNPSEEETINYRIRLKYAVQNPDGTYTDVESPSPRSAVDLLRFSPRSVTLAPRQSQTIKLLKRLPENTAPGDYTAYIVFTKTLIEKPLTKTKEKAAQGVTIELTPIPSFSIPINVTVGNPPSDSAALEYLGRNPEFTQQPMAKVRLLRKGGHNNTLRGDLSVWQNNKLLGRIKGKYLLAGTPFVDVQIPLSEPGRPAQGGQPAEILFTPYVEGDSVDTSQTLASVKAVL